MNILSLFDGMSCGRIALDRAGLEVDNYFASEIDKHAIKVSGANYPDIHRLGDVTQVKGADLPHIHLLMGGSPCQGFSFAGKQLAFDDPRSALFFEFVRLKKECKPDFFLLENVRMKKEYQDVISEYLGVEPIRINSNLVSAQNRDRWYWTNIPGIEQPADKGILLEDILEDGENLVHQRGRGNNPGGVREGKSPSMGASCWQENVKVPVIKNRGVLIHKPNKSQCLDANYANGVDNHGQRTRVLELREKSKCVRSGGRDSYDRHEWDSVDKNHLRKLTVTECERLQTVPDNYTNHVSNTQRYKMLGNGWTVDVIAHILEPLSIF
jgi:site-specific DNA-cytosine methylase